MRPETKKIIQEKLHRWLEGEQTHAIDPNGTWINVRDVRSIIDCETELLQKTIEKQKEQLAYAENLMIKYREHVGWHEGVAYLRDGLDESEYLTREEMELIRNL